MSLYAQMSSICLYSEFRKEKIYNILAPTSPYYKSCLPTDIMNRLIRTGMPGLHSHEEILIFLKARISWEWFVFLRFWYLSRVVKIIKTGIDAYIFPGNPGGWKSNYKLSKSMVFFNFPKKWNGDVGFFFTYYYGTC